MFTLFNFRLCHAVLFRCASLLLWASLAGCTNSANDSSVPAATLRLRASVQHTTAGGSAITLIASHNMNDATVSWSIAAQSPGRLDDKTGDTVHYLPPAAGSIASPASVVITATINGLTQEIELSLLPWPAAYLNVQRRSENIGDQASKFA